MPQWRSGCFCVVARSLTGFVHSAQFSWSIFYTLAFCTKFHFWRFGGPFNPFSAPLASRLRRDREERGRFTTVCRLSQQALAPACCIPSPCISFPVSLVPPPVCRPSCMITHPLGITVSARTGCSHADSRPVRPPFGRAATPRGWGAARARRNPYFRRPTICCYFYLLLYPFCINIFLHAKRSTPQAFACGVPLLCGDRPNQSTFARKLCRRSLWGFSKISRGVPSSTT